MLQICSTIGAVPLPPAGPIRTATRQSGPLVQQARAAGERTAGPKICPDSPLQSWHIRQKQSLSELFLCSTCPKSLSKESVRGFKNVFYVSLKSLCFVLRTAKINLSMDLGSLFCDAELDSTCPEICLKQSVYRLILSFLYY